MKEEAPKPPIAGIIYGEIAYWLVIIGMLVAIAGSAMYLTAGGYVDQTCFLGHLWKGDDVHTIWEECAGVSEVPHGHWYIGMLSYGDAVAMLGIAIGCFAAVIGMWGAFLGMLRSKESIYIIFALIVAIILLLSALGIISLKH
jgi:hypothetical protein